MQTRRKGGFGQREQPTQRPPDMRKMEHSRTWKRSRVVEGGKKGRGQGGGARRGCSLPAGCCAVHP